MGTNSAVITGKVIENAYEVLTIEMITIVQAIDALGFKDQVSSTTRKMYDDVRAIVPELKEDQVMYQYIQKVKEYLMK